MSLFSNIRVSQMTSKCGENKSITEQTHSNPEAICFHNKETKNAYHLK